MQCIFSYFFQESFTPDGDSLVAIVIILPRGKKNVPFFFQEHVQKKLFVPLMAEGHNEKQLTD